MTSKQEAAVEDLRRRMQEHGFLGTTGKYEFKSFDVTETDWCVEVRGTTGLIGDEGTMAEIFARSSWQLFVGKRGGLSAVQYNSKTRKTTVVHGRRAFWAGLRH